MTDFYDRGEKLRQLFAPYGEIKDAYVMHDNEGKSKGYGFVTFGEEVSADNAIKALNGMQLNRRLKLLVEKAKPTADKYLIKSKIMNDLDI